MTRLDFPIDVTIKSQIIRSPFSSNKIFAGFISLKSISLN